MKKLFLAFTLLFTCIGLTYCTNNPDKGSDAVEVYRYNVQSDTLILYVIHKPPTRWWYATSATELTSATQIFDTGWTFSTTQPSQITAEGTIELVSQMVVIDSLVNAPNLRTALSQ